MFCENCGAKLSENSIKCDKCGHLVIEELLTSSSGGLKGFFVLVVSFFTMPIKTLKITVQELRDIGCKGSLDIETTDVPHLTWLMAASHILASTVIVVIIIGGLGKALMSLQAIQYSVQGALTECFAYLVGGLLGATAADWGVMLTFEVLGLAVTVANGIKKISDRE